MGTFFHETFEHFLLSPRLSFYKGPFTLLVLSWTPFLPTFVYKGLRKRGENN